MAPTLHLTNAPDLVPSHTLEAGDVHMRSVALKVAATALAIGMIGTETLAAEPSVERFYKGLQMKMIIRAAPGGSYDTFARLLAQHMGRHIPGNPAFVNINMPGAGGIKAANYIVETAPRDGSIVSNISLGFPMQQALGLLGKVKADMRDFNWIGSFNATNQVLVVMTNAPTKSLSDAKQKQTLIGAASAVSTGAYLPEAYNVLLGTKFKVITGYQSMAAVKLGMERGEVEGLGSNGWSDLQSDFADLVDAKRLNVILQVGMKKEADLPDVPLLIDLAKTQDERAILEFITKGNSSIGKPFATSPGVPKERVSALRRAFDATMKDARFLADAQRARVEIDPIMGEDLQKLVIDIVTTPRSVTEKANAALGIKEAQ
jgi:tripartite-type tricarboxylate transporter receptor subunit TctC